MQLLKHELAMAVLLYVAWSFNCANKPLHSGSSVNIRISNFWATTYVYTVATQLQVPITLRMPFVLPCTADCTCTRSTPVIVLHPGITDGMARCL